MDGNPLHIFEQVGMTLFKLHGERILYQYPDLCQCWLSCSHNVVCMLLEMKRIKQEVRRLGVNKVYLHFSTKLRQHGGMVLKLRRYTSNVLLCLLLFDKQVNASSTKVHLVLFSELTRCICRSRDLENGFQRTWCKVI